MELEQHDVKLWDLIADSLLIWCRRGVDGFRCDAGYKIPTPAWQYIVARVQEEFPETIFLLEGLGGSWEATESLLTEGGMQWAYSELFQNYSGRDVAWYLDYANRQNERVGSYVNYSETHDNDRLAAQRPRVVAAAQPPVRADQRERRLRVHLRRGMAGDGKNPRPRQHRPELGRAENIVPELAQLNPLISDHPCFFDGAQLTRLSAPDAPVYALLRESAEGKDSVLVLANTDVGKGKSADPCRLEISGFRFQIDLLGQPLPKHRRRARQNGFHARRPARSFASRPTHKPAGLSGENYRRARALAAFAFEALNQVMPVETVDGLDWHWLAEQAGRSPKNFLAAASEFAARAAKLRSAICWTRPKRKSFSPRVVTWTLLDARRVTLVPPGHWLLIEDSAPFRATLEMADPESKIQNPAVHAQSIAVGDVHIACFAPRETAAEMELVLERYATTSKKLPPPFVFFPPIRNPQSAIRNPATWFC